MTAMDSLHTFASVAYNELLLHSKRVAPYALMILFSALAVLGWIRGPAIALGWATNSDFYIARSLKAYPFLFGVPIFNAMIMGDAVMRDFRLGINPLIFSKPLRRAEYLCGKFFGSFLVLVCSIATYPLTLLALQVFHPAQMVVQPFKVLPYLTHFFFFVVITQLAFAAFFFMIGTLTRNNKIVYFLAISFYPVFVASLLLVVSGRGKVLVDPFLLNTGPSRNGFGQNAEYLNQYAYSYTPDMILNRVGLIIIAVACTTWLYVRFTTADRSERTSFAGRSLNLLTATDALYCRDSPATLFTEFVRTGDKKSAIPAQAVLPNVSRVNKGIRVAIHKIIAALGIEFRLLRAERSLIVVAPLVLFLCLLEVAFYPIHTDVSLTAAYASNTATSLLIFLIGMAVFYTGEAMHRDREARIEPFLWATPIPNSVLILSKFLSTLLLLFALIASVGFAAIALQIIRQHTPIDFVAYLKIYGLILFPSAFILTALSVVGNVVLRNKHVFYVVSIGIAAGLFYLYSNGHNHWLYNPVMYRLWTYTDLISAAPTILLYRLSWLAVSVTCLVLAHLFFARRSRRKPYLPLPFALR